MFLTNKGLKQRKFLKVCGTTLELIAMSPALLEIKGLKRLEKGESNAQKVDTPKSY